MKYTELKNSIKEGAKPVYLLEGDDAYFRSNGEEQLKAAFLQMPELNYTSFDGETLKGAAISQLVSAVKSFPFMAEKRIVKVSEFYPTESEFENYIKPLFADFPPSSILIINNTGAKKGVDLKRKSQVSYFDCSRTDREAVAKWAYITLRRANVNAPVSVCESIADYCLCNMARVSVEVQKLIAYKGEGTLTQEEADALVYKDADFRLYELTNTVPAKNYTKFCRIADELLKKDGDEMYILNGLFNFLKNLLTVYASDLSVPQLAAQLKMKEFVVKKSREQAAAIGQKRIEELITYIYGSIAQIKGGQLTPQSALQSVQNAIFFGI